MTVSAFVEALACVRIAALLSCCAVTTTARVASPLGQGDVVQLSADSRALGERIDYRIYLPPGYANSTALYLLHGRGDSMTAWMHVKNDLDVLIGSGKIPPLIVVMPDAPWSGRGNWYVDSAYTGSDFPGRPVETTLTRDLVAAIAIAA